MNAGIIDAAHLKKALLEALASDDADALRAFAEHRRRDIAGVNRFTDILTRFLLTGRGKFIRPLFKCAEIVTEIPPLRRRILQRLAMVDSR